MATSGDPHDAMRAFQPRSLIVTIYGSYSRGVGGWLSVASLVALLGDLGVEEPAVRSAISRLKRRGVLTAEQVDGAAGYTLSDAAHAMFRDGDHRIFQHSRGKLQDGWVLAIFSVPENERSQRHQLRAQLGALGFGSAAAGVLIAPAHLAQEAREVLGRRDLSRFVDLFHADYLAFGDVQDQLGRWWDLDSIQAAYHDFLSSYEPTLTDLDGGGERPDRVAFAEYMRALTSWRTLVFLDPGLPVEVLPPKWLGERAAATFFALDTRLSQPAQRHFSLVAQRAPQ